MKQYRIASVPYVNAVPMVYRFERMGAESTVEVVYDVPSALPSMLDAGEVDAILVSSIYALRNAGLRFASGVCIGSQRAVRSVRLFSKVPFEAISSLALDSSSMTSNALARILLKDSYGVSPVVHVAPPVQGAMLAAADACVLIGDIGMTAPAEGLHVLDLGEAWFEATGLPFLWAGWVGRSGLTPELVSLLAGAVPASFDEDLIEYAAVHHEWPREMVRGYYTENMSYAFDARMEAGLRKYQERLLDHGFADCEHWPEIIAPSPANVG